MGTPSKKKGRLRRRKILRSTATGEVPKGEVASKIGRNQDRERASFDEEIANVKKADLASKTVLSENGRER